MVSWWLVKERDGIFWDFNWERQWGLIPGWDNRRKTLFAIWWLSRMFGGLFLAAAR